ncbi:MAG: hypothetical protein EXS36_10225 [Pedosphaera sp.]|nr:hypothetical protein [Pedosphaera sp.]
MTHHYPLALERIVCGLTRVNLNPATILISLDNHYFNARWLIERGSRLVSCDSTHGGLDDINSVGILLSNFTPTPDTSSRRVTRLFDDLPGLRQYRAEQSGAEWVTEKEQTLTRIVRTQFDRDFQLLPNDDVFLRIWAPQFSRMNSSVNTRAFMLKPALNAAARSKGPFSPKTEAVVRLAA